MGCVRRVWTSIGIAAALGIASCGGGSGSGTSPTPPATGTNVTTLLVDAGPAGAGTINASFATITLCAPGRMHYHFGCGHLTLGTRVARLVGTGRILEGRKVRPQKRAQV